MMMPNDHDSDGLEMNFEKNVVRKFLQITPAKTRGVEVVPFWVFKNRIKGLIKVIPEPSA